MKIMNHSLLAILMLIVFTCISFEAHGSTISTKSPAKTTKLIFIHHSCGENWLSGGNGGLGKALGKNNYFVSDTNYGWGPSNIGDRTDIVNWKEWFSSSKTPKYMNALLKENKKHSSYTRKRPDPGGENRIIMFKSCFPNSELRGHPNDAPKNGNNLTVANAKAIYNKLLMSFAKHPETLFVAITAPPVQNKEFSKNARAFNNWLVFDWLKNYKGFNVGVYDFYNTLTGPNNHHQISNKRFEHVHENGRNTLYYAPVGDDHPLTKGNKKAVKEFIPILNMFYNNWENKAKYTAPKKTVMGKVSKEVPNQSSSVNKKVSKKGVTNVADFENEYSEWEVFSDTDPGTKIKFKCESKKKTKALKIEYKVSNEGWGTCSLVYHSPVTWKKKKGISFKILSKEAGKKIDFIVYQGKASNDLHHFEIGITTSNAMVKTWQTIKIPFNKLRRPSWEGNQNDRIDLNFIQGVAIGFGGENNNKKSLIWIDDIKLY